MNNELCHHGIKGQKWGVLRTPEQLGHKTSSRKTFFKKKTQTKTNKETSEKKNMTPEEKEVFKEKILKSRSPKLLYKHADLFSDQELKNAYSRLVLEKNLKEMSPKEISRGEQYLNKALKVTKKATEVANTAAGAYESFNKIKKILDGGDSK